MSSWVPPSSLEVRKPVMSTGKTSPVSSVMAAADRSPSGSVTPGTPDDSGAVSSVGEGVVGTEGPSVLDGS